MIAENIFAFAAVGRVGVGPVVVERAEEGDAGVEGFPGFGVGIGLEGVPKLEGGAENIGVGFGIGPDAALGIGVLGGVGAKDGTESAELDPACEELGIDDSGKVTADVVAPIGVPDIGRRGRKPELEAELLP